MENDSVGDPFGELKAKISENLHEFRNFRFMRRHSVEKDVKDDGTLSFIFQPHTFRFIIYRMNSEKGSIFVGIRFFKKRLVIYM